MDELKPCAHCGCAEISVLTLIYDDKVKSFACDGCGCESPEFHPDDEQTRAGAIAAWNRRAPIASAPAAGGGEARDAARYRWLRGSFNEDGPHVYGPDDDCILVDEELDAAIDAALASPGAEGRETL